MIEILDTTLRDGEQTAGVAFSPHEKVSIAKLLLDEVQVDRIEVASARVSDGELKAFTEICQWAGDNGLIDRVEALGFVDNGVSIGWIANAGGKVINLLTKGSKRHVTMQLKKTPEEHLADIVRNVEMAVNAGLSVNVYLEDWSNGMRDSREYVYFLIDNLKKLPIKRFMLPDTLGILTPEKAADYCRAIIKKYPDLHFDFHAHNDYDLAVANVFSALSVGIHGIHTTVNGLGERAGNAPLASVVGILNDHLNLENNIDEHKLVNICNIVESFSGIRIPDNKPIVGESVFTQTSGVHADGDNKDNLYCNKLLPERFGRVRKYALGKMSGKANIAKNLEELGIRLTPEQTKKVTARIIELGDKKENVTTEDLPFIISDVLRSGAIIDERVRIINYSLSLALGLRPVATIRISIDDVQYEETAPGDGQYDAFMKALWKIYDRLGKSHPVLVDYKVTIPPGGKTDALVETSISWNLNGKILHTHGLDADQTEAAIKATLKMLNLIAN